MIPEWMQEYFPTKGSVPQWRKNVLIPFVLERDTVCWVEGCFKNVSDVHEGVVSRGDVQGWKLKNRVVIQVPINAIGLCRECHKYAPSRRDVLQWAIREYGEWVLDWFEALPFKIYPSVIQQVREENG